VLMSSLVLCLLTLQRPLQESRTPVCFYFFVKMKFWFEGFVEQSIERTCFSFWFSFFCSLFQYIEYEIEYVAWVLCS
jgi:hypothetical protein